jgi:hypothetical protein
VSPPDTTTPELMVSTWMLDVMHRSPFVPDHVFFSIEVECQTSVGIENLNNYWQFLIALGVSELLPLFF